jgi:hypothetical protein
MRAPRHVGTIHGCAINKRTPALLTTSRTGSARDRQRRLHRHHSPVTAALRPVYSPLLGRTKRRSPFSGPLLLPTASQLAATQRAPPGVQPAARPDKKKIALFRATVSADLLRIVRGCRGKYRHPTLVTPTKHGGCRQLTASGGIESDRAAPAVLGRAASRVVLLGRGAIFLGRRQQRDNQVLPRYLVPGPPVCRRSGGHNHLSARKRPVHKTTERARTAAAPLERATHPPATHARGDGRP